jgi:aerotaxis receptor
MCRWLINDVSSQVVSVRDGSDRLAQGNEDLNDRTRQTVANVQQTVATMNQMAASVQSNSETAAEVDKLSWPPAARRRRRKCDADRGENHG